MMAIRNAPLEKVLGEDVLGVVVAEIPSNVGRRQRAERAPPPKRVVKRSRPSPSPDPPTSAGAIVEDVESAADIIDPEMLLGLGVPLLGWLRGS
jgi:hypothetical protein